MQKTGFKLPDNKKVNKKKISGNNTFSSDIDDGGSQLPPLKAINLPVGKTVVPQDKKKTFGSGEFKAPGLKQLNQNSSKKVSYS
jgi:hypothetical protein